MREIKFQVFHKEANEMFCEHRSMHGINYYLNNPKYGVRQYTGLEDKNGRELYESDITKDKFGNLDVICWINSSGAYATVPINLYLEGEYEYTVVDEYGTDCFFENNVPGDYLEVIGNVYENPDLLEESK